MLPTKPCSLVPHLHLSLIPPRTVTPPHPWQSIPVPDHSFGGKVFPNIQPEPPLAQLEAIPSHPIASYLGEEADPCLTTTSFQAVVDSNVSPEPPLL